MPHEAGLGTLRGGYGSNCSDVGQLTGRML